MIDARLLTAELERLGVEASAAVRGKLLDYVAALERWNRAINLTNLQGSGLIRRLVAEPLWIAHQLQLSGKVADIGSGNGSPGIPLCVGADVGEAHLVESRSRRAAFLRQIVLELGLKGVTVHNNRVESLPAEAVGPVDWITLQAVRPEKTLLNALEPMKSPTTTIVWITSIPEAPVPGASRLAVPQSTTLVWLFR